MHFLPLLRDLFCVIIYHRRWLVRMLLEVLSALVKLRVGVELCDLHLNLKELMKKYILLSLFFALIQSRANNTQHKGSTFLEE